MQLNLISFDLRAAFGVFKKPDVNEGLQLTFNMLHKPALLGILGAIAGLEGYQRHGVFPDYYTKLGGLKVSIEPLDHEKGNFVKTVIKYTNTVGYANADGNLIITEQTLRCPSYRCYVLLDLDDEVHKCLFDRIVAGEAEYLPYFGKNECAAWWEVETVHSYTFQPFKTEEDFRIASLFVRKHPVNSQKVEPEFSFVEMAMQNTSSFIYFERLPVKFYVGDKQEEEVANVSLSPTTEMRPAKRAKSMNFVQYDLAEFAFTDWVLKKGALIGNLYRINVGSNTPRIIQLF